MSTVFIRITLTKNRDPQEFLRSIKRNSSWARWIAAQKSCTGVVWSRDHIEVVAKLDGPSDDDMIDQLLSSLPRELHQPFEFQIERLPHRIDWMMHSTIRFARMAEPEKDFPKSGSNLSVERGSFFGAGA